MVGIVLTRIEIMNPEFGKEHFVRLFRLSALLALEAITAQSTFGLPPEHKTGLQISTTFGLSTALISKKGVEMIVICDFFCNFGAN